MNPPSLRRVTATTVAVGFVTAGAQVTLLRELLVACGGNELAAGLALTCWMTCTAAGSAIAGRVVRAGASLDRSVGVLTGACLIALALALPSTMGVVLWARETLGPPGGEVVALHQALGICAVTLVVPCVLFGVLFPLLCRMTEHAGVGRSGARVFGWEAVGFGVGGLLFGLVLFGRVPVPVAMAGLSVVALAAVPGIGSGERRWGWGLAAGVACCVALTSALPRLGESDAADRETLVVRDTVHSRVEIAHSAGQYDVYLDGLWAFSYPDPETTQWTAHPPLLLHPQPRRVLLVGGIVSGVLSEVLTHPTVEQVDAVEIDPQLVSIARARLPSHATQALDDPRVALNVTDGRAFVRNAEGPYDVVLLARPDPRNAQLNRVYTAEFFGLCARLLADGGILATGVTGSADMLGPNQAQYVASVRSTLAARFEHVIALPGGRVTFVASEHELAFDPDEMAARLQERSLEPAHVRPFELPFSLGPFRVDYLQQVLDGADRGQVNRDLTPLCFHQDTVLWASVQAPRLVSVLSLVERAGLRWLLALLLAGGVIHALAVRVGPRRLRATAVPAAVAAMGATGIVAEVALILGYQVAFGHLFARIGVIVAAYMIGLAGGALLTVRGVVTPGRRALMAVQGVAVIGCAGLAWVSSIAGVASLPASAEPIFAVLTALAGLVAGLHFPCAVAVLRGGERGAVGGLYAWDLAGAAAGSLVASAVLLPVLGVAAVFWALAALNAGATLAVAAMTSEQKTQDQT